jgi:ferritin
MLKPEIVLKLKEQFKAEMSAYNAYHTIKNMIEDDYLEEALEEVMYDEFLHAKFLRSYMIEHNLYDPAQHVDCEKSYHAMIEE